MGLRMLIEVVYGNAETQTLLTCVVSEGILVKEAIIASGILQRYPKLQIENLKVGIFSKKADLNTVLKADDRIEIYLPLKIDPKAARRLRAAKPKN